ncbi:MAG: hypothetical protein HC852_01940 [Acaryochloridaceae cyanobacterium RU_4_10]|nr:hypothetical protein [Acaryochloridaceae cyanobacterium RU_4_10]
MPTGQIAPLLFLLEGPPEPKAEPQQQQTKAQQRGTASKNGSSASTEADPVLKHSILTKTLKDGQPFVSYLLEVSQGLRLPNPEFEFQQEEEGYFVCECRLDFKSQQFVGEATATKKQRAKHLAARVVLEQLQAIAQ